MKRLRPAIMMTVTIACGGAGQPQADAAFERVEQAITDQHTQAIRYAPDAFKRVMDDYDAARAEYAAGEYRRAIEGAERTLELTEQLPSAIGAGRRAVSDQFTAASDEVRELLAALETRVSTLENAPRLPTGVAADDVTQVRQQLPVLQRTFDEATTTFQRGNLAEALHVVTQVRQTASGFTDLVGGW